ncbi:MAG TPA: type II toxin-antitoxin system HicA family toxin [Candidatus Paceibacterota bacterium]
MPKLKILSSKDIVKILGSFSFETESQHGSHIKLSRVTVLGRQVLIVPNHDELDKGTIKAIFNQANKYIPRGDLIGYFYTK